MEKQRTHYIQADEFERSDELTSQSKVTMKENGQRVLVTLNLAVLKTSDGNLSSDVIDRYQRN